jgi:hypothetical protein
LYASRATLDASIFSNSELKVLTAIKEQLEKKHKNIIIKNLLLSLIIQTLSPLVFYLTALAVGLKVRIIYFLISGS